MSSRDRITKGITHAVVILLLLTVSILIGIGQFYVRIFLIISVLAISLSLMLFGTLKRLLREAQAAKPVAEHTTSPVYYEDATPEDVESEMPTFSCPDCGYKNPGDAEFCIKCGRELEGSL